MAKICPWCSSAWGASAESHRFTEILRLKGPRLVALEIANEEGVYLEIIDRDYF